MEAFIETIKAVIYLGLGAYLAPWVATRFEKKKRRESLMAELAQKTHLLFCYLIIYTRHSGITKLHNTYVEIQREKFEKEDDQRAKELIEIFRIKMQDEIDAAIKVYHTQVEVESEILKLQIEATGLLNSKRAKQYKKVIEDILGYSQDPNTTTVFEEVNAENYIFTIHSHRKMLQDKLNEIEKAGKGFVKKIEAIV